ncbi:MAG: hypothetical protein R3A78_08865 [Polyangiales bacterium]
MASSVGSRVCGSVLGLAIVVVVGGCSANRDGNDFGGTGGDNNDVPQLINPDGGTGGGGGGGGGGHTGVQAACNKMDILFVVDDSASMGEEQANLAANFPKFAADLNNYRTENGQPLDYQLGITTTGVSVTHVLPSIIPGFPGTQEQFTGTDGRLVQSTSCGMSGRFVSSSESNADEVFACAAQVGINDREAAEMPLRAVELAVQDRMNDGTNSGFLREDALFAVVILTDEDDCSKMGSEVQFSATTGPDCSSNLFPADHLVGVLDKVTGDRKRWAATVIAGPAGSSECQSEFGLATPGNRLQSFVTAAGSNAVFSSICDGDLSASLVQALNVFNDACQQFVIL